MTRTSSGIPLPSRLSRSSWSIEVGRRQGFSRAGGRSDQSVWRLSDRAPALELRLRGRQDPPLPGCGSAFPTRLEDGMKSSGA